MKILVFIIYKRLEALGSKAVKKSCFLIILQIIHTHKQISVERPQLPIFTIHDSVAKTAGNQDYVSSIIKEEALNLAGFNSKLGLEYRGILICYLYFICFA